MTKRLLIVAHAPSDNTRALRDAVERGALSETGIDVRVVAPLQSGPEDVLAAQAVILGTTENLGYMSGALKDFFDRSYNPLLDKTQGLPCALYIRAGSDGTGTRRGVETILSHAPVDAVFVSCTSVRLAEAARGIERDREAVVPGRVEHYARNLGQDVHGDGRCAHHEPAVFVLEVLGGDGAAGGEAVGILRVCLGA